MVPEYFFSEGTLRLPHKFWGEIWGSPKKLRQIVPIFLRRDLGGSKNLTSDCAKTFETQFGGLQKSYARLCQNCVVVSSARSKKYSFWIVLPLENDVWEVQKANPKYCNNFVVRSLMFVLRCLVLWGDVETKHDVQKATWIQLHLQ